MRNNSSASNYDQLTPKERLNLVIQAAARGDEAEVARLHTTCPRRNYVELDSFFWDRRCEILRIAALVCIDLDAKKNELESLRLVAAQMFNSGGFALEKIADIAFELGYGCAYRVGMGDDPGRDPEDCIDEEIAEERAKYEADTKPAMDGLKAMISRFTGVFPEIIEHSVFHCAVRFMTTWEGFCRFCRSELELEPLIVLKSLQMPSDDLEKTIAFLSNVPFNEKAASDYAAAFAKRLNH
jgi:hypothetical protein